MISLKNKKWGGVLNILLNEYIMHSKNFIIIGLFRT